MTNITALSNQCLVYCSCTVVVLLSRHVTSFSIDLSTVEQYVRRFRWPIFTMCKNVLVYTHSVSVLRLKSL